ncbi:hypothetical protein B0W47_16560 (plasmid) [Komagataeibacter nataicola]|nr:hypothetical protein B0W47_16560 [Komagataeibacter nataicola]
MEIDNDEDMPAHKIIEGDNLKIMASLEICFGGKVDLIVTDPPYNTGKDFRYNDNYKGGKASILDTDDKNRHAHWLTFMRERLFAMRKMLSNSGIIAICIDSREETHLGCLMNEIFGEDNFITKLTWVKKAAANDAKRFQELTEAVFIYAKDINKAVIKRMKRDPEKDMKAYDKNKLDDDVEPWTGYQLTARSGTKIFAIQSPFTGELHYPGTRYWIRAPQTIADILSEYGSQYVIKDIGDGHAPAVVLDGCEFKDGKCTNLEDILLGASQKARDRYAKGSWPSIWFGKDGKGTPYAKKYLKDTKAPPPKNFLLQTESGGVNGKKELSEIVGKWHDFKTVKPLKLIKYLIEALCPEDGIVMDPFAGSGTTGHAVLDMNREGDKRTFIMMEQGNEANDDMYARSLTYERVKAVIGNDNLSFFELSNTPFPRAI